MRLPRDGRRCLDNMGKQNGRQIVFVEASAALQRGGKVGLVGPNGAGKTTLFWMITGQEQPDEGHLVAEAPSRGLPIAKQILENHIPIDIPGYPAPAAA